MKSNAKDWGRMLLFYVLACTIFWIPIAICKEDFLTETPKAAIWEYPSMYAPAIAAILTRLLTKEGWKDSFLHFNFEKKWKYYFIGPIGQLLVCSFGLTVALFVFKSQLVDIPDYETVTRGDLFLQFISNFGSVLLFGIITFGEELGWRGYLMPRLEKKIGALPAIIVGGILWGLWHAPLFQYGYNFGKDYPGFPYLGIAVMCVGCTASNAFYTWLTKRSGSIWPSTLAHAENNSLGGVLAQFIFFGKTSPDNLTFYGAVILIGCQLLISIFFMYRCCKKPAFDMP